MNLEIKRVYLAPGPDDGYRVLVDRIWPRGVSRDAAGIDEWAKEIAPSTAPRQWFNHDPARWSAFKTRYRAELATPEAAAKLADLRQRARKAKMTLVFAARDEVHCNAAALRTFLMGKAKA